MTSIDLSQHEYRFFSQNGEDGILIKLIQLLYENYHDHIYVEFGVEDGKQCNTRVLHDFYNWTGLQMDGSYTKDNDGCYGIKFEFITRENIVSLFDKYKVPQHINVLSIDIDFNDFYVLKEIVNHAYTMDIIVCEYNATHLPHEDKVVTYQSNMQWDYTNYFGASLLAFYNLLSPHGYTLVYCESRGVNCFFVRTELLSSRHLTLKDMNDVTTLYKSPKYGQGPNGGHREDVFNRVYLTSFDCY
uniref:Methyltransferase FkbM domain-containing protein n=1 Tax=viral metagenome TaxID=1070528 RepID=A0A6C0CPV2_9ZZZZ